MSIPAADVTAMFAVPLVTLPLPGSRELNPALLSLFNGRATAAHHDPHLRVDPLCFRSREDLFEWPGEAPAALRRDLLGCVCQAVMAANTFTDAEFDAFSVQGRARFVIVRRDGALPATSVPLASWCALYCVAAPAPNPARPDSGALRLYESRMANMFLDASNWRLRPPFSPGHQLWLPTPGAIAVFPASVLHEVALNRGDGDLVLVVARFRFARQDMDALPPW
jgi:hypothetical protein